MRLDSTKEGFRLSDGGQAALYADLAGIEPHFSKEAPQIAKIWDVEYQKGEFSINVSRDQVVAAAAFIANSSVQALEKTFLFVRSKRTNSQKKSFKEQIKKYLAIKQS